MTSPRRRHFPAPLLLILALLLTGCGGGIRPGIDDQRHWQISGKIGLRGPQLAESAYFNWRQCGDDYDLRLSTPLGQTVARIEGRGDNLTVSIQDRPPVTTAQPEQFLLEQLGWTVPIRALRYWVRAEAAPGAEATIDGSPGQPQRLRQFDWQVDYPAYHPATASNAALPAKLILRGTDLQATLLIKDWLLSDAVTGCPAP